MSIKLAIGTLCALAVMLGSVFLVRRPTRETTGALPETANPPVSVAISKPAATSASAEELLDLLRQRSSTNNDLVIKSGLSGQLIAEQLRTNRDFHVWATNIGKSLVVKFLNSGIPIYGVTQVAPDDVNVEMVTAMARTGLWLRCQYASLEIEIMGGTNPIISMARSPYHMANHQLDRLPQKERKNWSYVTAPLDKSQVDRLAREAFKLMTERDLETLNVQATIKTPGIPNYNAEHPEVQVTGIAGAKLISRNDDVFPFAFFSYSPPDSSDCPLKGEMFQTRLGGGEFVDLFVGIGTPDALFGLGDRFLHVQSGDWARNILTTVRSLSEDQQAALWKRMFSK